MNPHSGSRNSRPSAIVIGAGLAGAAVCERLCTRGWRVDLIEAHAEAAQEASGNHAGSFHPLLARDDNRLARLTHAGVKFGLRYWRELEVAGHGFSWSACGALQLSRDDGKADPAVALAAGRYAPQFARSVTQAEASDIAGVPVTGGGVFFGAGGWVQPASLVRAQLARCAVNSTGRLTTHFGRTVSAAARSGNAWELADAHGHLIARASVVVLAGGVSARLPDLFNQSIWPVESIRGQLTVLRAGVINAPRVPVHRDGYVLPQIDGQVVVGATYERAASQSAEHANRANIGRLGHLLAAPFEIGSMSTGRAPATAQVGRTAQDAHTVFAAPESESRVAYRAVARDRLPVIGALPDLREIDAPAVMRAGARLIHVPRLPGVYAAGAYASRGLTWAALGAEVLACRLDDTAPPLEAPLLDAIDPARFALHALRRGWVAR